jgi:hypothetical protein
LENQLMTMFSQMAAALKASTQPASVPVPTMPTISVPTGYTKPACLPQASLSNAQAACALKNNQQAASGFLGALGDTDPYADGIASDPCGWSLIPLCAPPPPKPSMHDANFVAPKVAVAPAPLPAPVYVAPPPPPVSHTPLIIGGILLGALVLGGVFYMAENH